MGFAKLSEEQQKASVVTISETSMSKSSESNAHLTQVITKPDAETKKKEEPQKHYMRVTVSSNEEENGTR